MPEETDNAHRKGVESHRGGLHVLKMLSLVPKAAPAQRSKSAPMREYLRRSQTAADGTLISRLACCQGIASLDDTLGHPNLCQSIASLDDTLAHPNVCQGIASTDGTHDEPE